MWVTVAEDWLQCAGALVMDQGPVSSCECWCLDWPSFVVSHFLAAPQFLSHQASPALDGSLQRPLQIQLVEGPALLQDGTFYVQHLLAAGSPSGASPWLCQVTVVPLHVLEG